LSCKTTTSSSTFVVGGRESFQSGEEARALSHHSPALASDQLEAICIFLLRHEAAACAVRIRKLEERWNEVSLRGRDRGKCEREREEGGRGKGGRR
tara:strand:+ start:48 stop:335 length:288 start_codon:yes stop_codon:yes gene_type:complete